MPSGKYKHKSHQLFQKNHSDLVPKESRKKQGKKISKKYKGKGNPMFGKKEDKAGNWQGGKTPYLKKLRNSKEFQIWRLKVFERDNWICQSCRRKSKKSEPVYLQAHHIKSFANYPELRFVIDNGITLCRECHSLIHKRKL